MTRFKLFWYIGAFPSDLTKAHFWPKSDISGKKRH